jgi:hypothetical protein
MAVGPDSGDEQSGENQPYELIAMHMDPSKKDPDLCQKLGVR